MAIANISKKLVLIRNIDGTLIIPWLLLPIVQNWVFFYTLCAITLIMIVLSEKKINIMILGRILRVLVTGRFKLIRPTWRKHIKI